MHILWLLYYVMWLWYCDCWFIDFAAFDTRHIGYSMLLINWSLTPHRDIATPIQLIGAWHFTGRGYLYSCRLAEESIEITTSAAACEVENLVPALNSEGQVQFLRAQARCSSSLSCAENGVRQSCSAAVRAQWFGKMVVVDMLIPLPPSAFGDQQKCWLL